MFDLPNISLAVRRFVCLYVRIFIQMAASDTPAMSVNSPGKVKVNPVMMEKTCKCGLN